MVIDGKNHVNKGQLNLPSSYTPPTAKSCDPPTQIKTKNQPKSEEKNTPSKNKAPKK